MSTFEITAGSMTFRGIEEGPSSGPLALLLHGFPDTQMTWRHLMGPLAEAGFHAVAPALRGYAPSDLAPDDNYQVGSLALDVIALHEAFGGGGDAVLVGHDWGAVVAYCASAYSPETFSKMVTISVPPTSSVAESFLNYDQLRLSWYMFFFQNDLADFVVGADDLEFVARLWADWSPSYDATEDMGFVREAIGAPDRLAAALKYYRAMFQPNLQDPSLKEAQDALGLPTPIPTAYFHGSSDGCFRLESIGDPLTSFPEGSRVEIIEDAGHWLHLEKPDEVNAAILDFLT